MADAPTIIIGFTHWGGPGCPYCGSDYIMVQDDGRDDSYQAVCWCGSKARCRKDDPDLLAKLAPASRSDEGRDE